MTPEQPDDPHKQLADILEQDRVGEIQGVRFDLRHPGLDPEVYFAPDFVWQLYAAGIRCPWNEDRSDPEVKIVDAGDRVFFHKVDKFNRGEGLLTDPHDAFDLWAYIAIERSSGQIDVLDEPISFVAKDAMGPYAETDGSDRDDGYREYIENHHVTFKKIAFRIERLRKSEQLTGEKGQWLKLADEMLSQAFEESEYFKENVKEDIGTLIDLVATAGYALARAESATTLMPLAQKALNARKSRAAATEAARRANLKADTPEMLSQASVMCVAEPNLSLTTCAKRLGEQFGRDPRNVREAIKHLFERRQLPSGRLEYRPKRTKG